MTLTFEQLRQEVQKALDRVRADLREPLSLLEQLSQAEVMERMNEIPLDGWEKHGAYTSTSYESRFFVPVSIRLSSRRTLGSPDTSRSSLSIYYLSVFSEFRERGVKYNVSFEGQDIEELWNKVSVGLEGAPYKC